MPAEGRHWARECRPKAVTGPALGTGVPAEGRHWPALGPAEGLHWPALGHGVPGQRPARRCPFGIVCILAAHVSAVTLAVDSGLTWHLHHRRDQLHNLRSCKDSVKGIGGGSNMYRVGDLEISTLDENGRETTIKLTNVRLTPDVDIALISVRQLIGANFEVMLGTPLCPRSPISEATLPLHMSNGLYLLKGHAAPSPTRHEAAEINVTHAAAFSSARDPHSTSHIAALPPEEAARHMFGAYIWGWARCARCPPSPRTSPRISARREQTHRPI